MCICGPWVLNLHYFMSDSMSTVLVFRTSVKSVGEIVQLSPLLNALINKNGRWNFDLEDCDNIFRVETKDPNVFSIEMLFRKQGFLCEELH